MKIRISKYNACNNFELENLDLREYIEDTPENRMKFILKSGLDKELEYIIDSNLDDFLNGKTDTLFFDKSNIIFDTPNQYYIYVEKYEKIKKFHTYSLEKLEEIFNKKKEEK